MLQPTPLEASAPAPPGEKADAVNTAHVHDGPTTLAVARPGDAVHLLLAEVCRSVGSGAFARGRQRQRPATRPAFGILRNERWLAEGRQPLRPWREALASYLVARKEEP